MMNLLLLIEAISSVALSHEANCACVVCRAAGGDEEALYSIALSAYIEEDR